MWTYCVDFLKPSHVTESPKPFFMKLCYFKLNSYNNRLYTMLKSKLVSHV